MPGRLDRIEGMLREALGSELLSRCPDAVYAVNAILIRYLRTPDTLPQLLSRLDSSLFNAIYTATESTMLVRMDDGRVCRVTGDAIFALSDGLLALAYERLGVSPSLQSDLFDLARAGSLQAMRALVSRFPLEEDEREQILGVLRENGAQA